MREIPAMFFEAVCRSLEASGVNYRPHLRGLSLARVEPKLWGRVDWSEFAIFLNRVGATLTPEEQEAVGARYVDGEPVYTALLSLRPPPRLFFQAYQRLTRLAFPFIREATIVEADRIILELKLPNDAADSMFYFRATIGQHRRLHQRLGLTGPFVVAELGPRGCRFEFHLGEENSITSASPRLPTLKKALMGISESLGLALGHDVPEDASRVLQLQQRNGLTRAEARVAVRLAAGKRLPEIAEDLGIQLETVRTHLKRIYRKTDTSGQADLVRYVLANAGRSGLPEA